MTESAHVVLNLSQVQQLHALYFNEPDAQTLIAIRWFGEGKDLDDGSPMPEGLYAFWPEYPDEGRVYLDPDESL